MDILSAHLDRGWDLVNRGDTTQALVAARRALDLAADAPEVHNLLGYIHALDGDRDEALACYDRALDLDEWYFDALLNAAEILAAPGADPEKAIRLCQRALDVAETREETADALLLEAEALLGLERFDEASSKIGEIGEPHDLPAHHVFLLARLEYDLGGNGRAKTLLDRAIELDPANADAWYLRGLIARDEGRRIDAVVDFLATRERDLAMPRPPWSRSWPPIAGVIDRAILALPAARRAALEKTRIVVEPYPSEEQIRHEIDPRQIVVAHGIDPATRCYETLFVFFRNLERAWASRDALVDELTDMIENEIGDERLDIRDPSQPS